MQCKTLEGLTRPQWLEERRKRICASDIASIIGVGFHTPQKLAAIKLGIVEDVEVSERMRLGTILEPEAVARWEEKTGRVAFTAPSLCIHPLREWQGATPDRLIDGFKEILEAKLVFDYPDHEWGPDGSAMIPEKYVCQTTWQMDTLGASMCDLSAYFIPHFQRTYKLRYDPELAGMLVRAGKEFLDFITSYGIPPADWQSSLAVGIKSRIEAVKPGEVKKLDDDAEALAAEYLAVKAVAKEADGKAKQLRQILEELAGDAADCFFPGGGFMSRKLIKRDGFTVPATEYTTLKINLTPKKKGPKNHGK